jgi:hypothetical protein
MQLLMGTLLVMLGIAITFALMFVYAWYLGMKERVQTAEKAKKVMEDAIKHVTETLEQRVASRQASSQVQTDPNISASVKERLRKVVEITLKQVKIDTRKGPEFIMQNNELELEKLSVLKTILADGFDPVITVRHNTGEQEILLSTYVQALTKGLA